MATRYTRTYLRRARRLASAEETERDHRPEQAGDHTFRQERQTDEVLLAPTSFMICVSLRRAKAATRTVTAISTTAAIPSTADSTKKEFFSMFRMANSRSTSLRWSTTESMPALQISLPRESVLPEQNRSCTWSNWFGSRSLTR